MKILRKRVGSFLMKGSEDEYIVREDSIYKDEEIVFNYLPIKNLQFFNLIFKKSSIEKKCWVYLDLNLNKLHDFLIEGKTLTNRQILFEIISCSYNKNRKFNYDKIFLEVERKKYVLDNIKIEEFDKRMKIYDKRFVKFGKIFFDLENKLTTINKCKLKTIKIPNFIIINNLYEISIYDSLLNIFKNEKENENLVIISKKNDDIINRLFIKKNGTNYIKFKSIIYSEDLNHQMNNYQKNIISSHNSSINDFINQLNFESKNFFYRKKNIFILCKNLNEFSYNYLSNCQYENIFLLESLKIKENMKIFLKKYNDYRVDYKQENIVATEYILNNNVFKLEVNDNYEDINYEIYEFPLEDWYEKSDSHILDFFKKNKLISSFIKIGKRYEWNEDSINKLEIKNSENFILTNDKLDSNDKCPISMTPLNSFSVKTSCNHRFNLKSIIQWISNNNDCPICRSNINLNKLEFNYIPNCDRFIEQIKDKKNWILIIDKIWNQYLNISKFQGIVIKQSELTSKSLNQLIKFRENYSEYEILNMTMINNLDIKFLLRINNESNVKFIKIYEKI